MLNLTAEQMIVIELMVGWGLPIDRSYRIALGMIERYRAPYLALQALNGLSNAVH